MNWKRTPFKHQEAMAAFHIDHLRSFDLSDVGTGKTLPMVQTLRHVVNADRPSKVLVICPNSIVDNWKNELELGSDLKVQLLRAPNPIKRLQKLLEPADVYVINFEGVRTIFGPLMFRNFPIVIVDEAHHIKSPKAQQTKLILKLGKQATIRKAMSGTLVTNDLEDVWAPAQFVEPKIFNCNQWGFKQRYMQDKNAGKPWMKFPDWQPRPGAVEEVRKKLEPYAIRFEKRDVLKFLPPVLFEKRLVTLDDEQRRVYKELKREFMADLDDGTIVLAAQILPRITKLIEVTSGFLYTETEPGKRSTYRFKQNAKLNELHLVLAEIGNKRTVIWASFKEDIAIVRNSLSLDARVITGDTPAAERQNIVDLFNSNQFQHLICNPQAAGEGLTILAPYAIYFSRSWKLGERLQSLGRHDRPGAEQFENITVIDIVAENTIDVEVLNALHGKEDLLKSINPKRIREMLT
jgi:SNF2 family DNA or RNA helicase